ncbi:MAG: phosphotransferase, partial [Chloroflexi bacterium]|nr:phosphotransferase [Chloroflexota bacterium]
RLHVEYDNNEAGAPQSLVVKLPTDNPVMRKVVSSRGLYMREVRFYEEIAEQIELRTPRRYYSAFDSESGGFVLLLEDLAPARVGDQVAGCSAADAELAIREIAKFHAAWWESPKIADIDWMPSARSGARAFQQLYQRSWSSLRGKMGDKLPDTILDIGERLGPNIVNVRERAAEPPQTIVQGDFRLDNMFFASPDGGAPFAAVDWQLIHRNRGVYDVAWFLSGCLDPETRKSTEMELLKLYQSTLEENGVRDYGIEQCVEDYRHSLLSCLMIGVIAAAAADLSTERGLALFGLIMQRMASAIADHDAAELLPKE